MAELEDEGWLHIPSMEDIEWKKARKYLYPSYVGGSIILGTAWIATRDVLNLHTNNLIQDAGLMTGGTLLASIILGNAVGIYITGKTSQKIVDLKTYGKIMEDGERNFLDRSKIILMWLLGPLLLAMLYDVVTYSRGWGWIF